LTNAAFSRSQGIIDPDATLPISIIGCGSLGSFAALTLAKMGFHQFNLFDNDLVGVENIGCQLFGWEHIGRPKTEALREILSELSPVKAEDIQCFGLVGTGTKLPRVITVSAVDSMAVRSLIWGKVKDKIPLFVDGRIGGQVIRVFSVRAKDYAYQEHYEKTLYSDAQADDLPCTARNVADVGLFVGAMVARAVRRFVSHNHVIKETALDALTFTTYTVGEESYEPLVVL
jgi:hypothetical protein